MAKPYTVISSLNSDDSLKLNILCSEQDINYLIFAKMMERYHCPVSKFVVDNLIDCTNNEEENDKMKRTDKHNYYLDIAETVAKRGTCLRRNFGAIIVNNDEIISTGYTGAPRHRKNCLDIGTCQREKLNIPRGERYELCRSVHGEANAIISASRADMLGGILYLAGIDYKTKELVDGGEPCAMCKRMIINAGIYRVIVRDTCDKFRIIDVETWVNNDDSLTEKLGY